MVKMQKQDKVYEIAEHRVEKLLKRGFQLVDDTPEVSEDVTSDQEDQQPKIGD